MEHLCFYTKLSKVSLKSDPLRLFEKRIFKNLLHNVKKNLTIFLVAKFNLSAHFEISDSLMDFLF